MKGSPLSRYQEQKKVFLQLGKKFYLPPDIIKYLYNSLKKSYQKEEEVTRKFNGNTIIFEICKNIGGPPTIFPDGRGLEWVIRCRIWGRTWFSPELTNRYQLAYKEPKGKINLFIKILGEEKYLYQRVDEEDYNNLDNLIPATKERKILYLNLSAEEEIAYDYKTHNDQIENNEEPIKIIINKFGDSSII